MKKLYKLNDIFCDCVVKYAIQRYQKEHQSGRLSEEEKEKIAEEHRSISILRKFVDVPDIFIHFSDTERASFNPRYDYKTPFGIYAYPLTSELFFKISNFGLNRKYIHIYRFFGNKLDTNEYNEDDFSTDYKLLYTNYKKISEEEFKEYIEYARENRRISEMWNITRMIAKQDAFVWSSILKDLLGYDYVVDISGVVHPSEPYQAVCLISKQTGKANYHHITTIKNDLQALSFALYEANQKNPNLSTDRINNLLKYQSDNLPPPIKCLTEEKDLIWAVEKEETAINAIKDPSEAVQFAAIKGSPYAIRYIKNPTEMVQIEAVKRTGHAIMVIKNPSETVQLEAATQDGEVIRLIPNPSETVQLAAIKQNRYAIALITNPTEAAQVEAVKQKGILIQFIKNPCEAAQLAAIKQNKNAFWKIKEPTEAAFELAASLELAANQ